MDCKNGTMKVENWSMKKITKMERRMDFKKNGTINVGNWSMKKITRMEKRMVKVHTIIPMVRSIVAILRMIWGKVRVLTFHDSVINTKVTGKMIR